MNGANVSDLLSAYLRLAGDEVENWSGWLSRWAELLRRLQDPPVGDLSELAGGSPRSGLLVAVGHYVDGDDGLAVEALGPVKQSLVGQEPDNEAAAALAAFYALLGASEEAAELFTELAAAGWTFSLAEGAFFAESLFRSGGSDDGLGVALGGVRELQRRRQALSDTALRLNFGGQTGQELSRTAATAAFARVWREEDPEQNAALAIGVLELVRDPLLAETVHTSARAPIPVLTRLDLIRACWAAEAAAFQWRELLRQLLTEQGRGPDADLVERRLDAAEVAAQTAHETVAREAPSLFSFFFSPGRSLLRSPVEGDVTYEAQRQLEAGTAVLGFELLEEAAVGWAISPDGLLLSPLAISPKQLAAAAASVLGSCIEGSLAANGDLAPLADAVLGWADGLLETTERLYVVPTGALRTIPFVVLPWRGRPLVASHTCSVLPTLGVLADLAERPTRDLREASLVAFGNPVDMRWTSPTGDVVPMRGLRFAEAESTVAKELAGQRGVAHNGSEATREAALDALRTAGIVHLATHARFCAEAPLFSAILLADGEQLTGIDLIATNAGCELIVASACRTGEGARTTGDDVLGLSRGLLGCGARAAIVSLWPVDDRRTAELMGSFYRGLFGGLDPAQALRSAQLPFLGLPALEPTEARDVERGIRVEPGEVSGSERFWAPFVLVGV
jgi:hypothetical protein